MYIRIFASILKSRSGRTSMVAPITNCGSTILATNIRPLPWSSPEIFLLFGSGPEMFTIHEGKILDWSPGKIGHSNKAQEILFISI